MVRVSPSEVTIQGRLGLSYIEADSESLKVGLSPRGQITVFFKKGDRSRDQRGQLYLME
jgi:hypothetical protein